MAVAEMLEMLGKFSVIGTEIVRKSKL